MLGVLGRSDIEAPGLEGSVELPDQLKALRLVRGGVGGVSGSVLSVSVASEGVWSDFSELSDSSFDSFDSATLRSELAKNLQEKPNESKRRTEAVPSGKLTATTKPLPELLLYFNCKKKSAT